MCERREAPPFPRGASQGQLPSGLAAGLSETALVLIFLPSTWVRNPAE